MKAQMGWTVALWIAWFIITAVFVFGAAVRVEFIEPAVPFSLAWDSINLNEGWSGALRSDSLLGWAFSLLVVLVYTFSRCGKVKLGAVGAGFLMPILAIKPMMLVVMVVSPLMIFEILFGTPDGEFYNEGWPMFAACGLWMIVCLVFAGRAIWVGRCERKSAPGGQL